MAGNYNAILKYAGGSVQVVADVNTAVPGGTGNFGQFARNVSTSGGAVAFASNLSVPWAARMSIYSDVGGSLRVEADQNTLVPGGVGTFQNFSLQFGHSLDGGNIAFIANDEFGVFGVYTNAGGGLHTVADGNTAIPGGNGNFFYFAQVELSGTDVAFVASGLNGGPTPNGIYARIGGVARAIADVNTPIPGGIGNFTELAWMSISNGVVAFQGQGSDGQWGIYADVGGVLHVVADANTPIPCGVGNFRYVVVPSIDQGRVAFLGYGTNWVGIYYAPIGGPLTKIVDSSDFFNLDFDSGGLSGDEVAFSTYSFVGQPAVYVAQLDDPFVCGDGFVDPGEQCDDGNGSGGDCCDCKCRFEAPGGSCGAGTCDGAGVCVAPTDTPTHTPTETPTSPATETPTSTPTDAPTSTATPTGTATDTASATSTPTPAAGCPALPASACYGAGESVVSLKNKSDPSRNKFLWKWTKGTASLQQADFGNPESGTAGYALCIYDQRGGVPVLVLGANIEAGGSCGATPCWKPASDHGWSYKNRDGNSAGITAASLKGGVAGKPKVQVNGKGASLPTPAPHSAAELFAQDPAVIVQLHGSNPLRCWTSSFDGPSTKKNDSGQFRAVAP